MQQAQKSVPGIPSQSFAHTNTQLTTPCSWVLLENLSDFQLVKKLPAFYRTWRFITTFTKALHLSLSSDSWKNIMNIKMLSIIYLHWYNTFPFTASFHNRNHLFCSAGCHLHIYLYMPLLVNSHYKASAHGHESIKTDKCPKGKNCTYLWEHEGEITQNQCCNLV